MFRRWRFQFGLKAFLLAARILPPIIAYQYRHWRYERFWQGLEIAKQRRDASLVAWRRTYDLFQTGKAAEAQEVAARCSTSPPGRKLNRRFRYSKSDTAARTP